MTQRHDDPCGTRPGQAQGLGSDIFTGSAAPRLGRGNPHPVPQWDLIDAYLQEGHLRGFFNDPAGRTGEANRRIISLCAWAYSKSVEYFENIKE